MGSLLTTTEQKARHYKAALWAGFWGGNIASFVKWGMEVVMPPRTADRGIPPADMLASFGVDVTEMTYQFSGHMINWGIANVHHMFSIVFALFYCVVAEIFPKIKLWQGVAFGLVITIAFHGIILPLGGWAPAAWDLPGHEIIAETIGHAAWMWTIEIFRRDIRNRITNKPDAEYQA